MQHTCACSTSAVMSFSILPLCWSDIHFVTVPSPCRCFHQIFNKSLLAKFAWSMDVEPEFRF